MAYSVETTDGVWNNKLLIIAIILVVIGALAWGWIGLTRRNFVAALNDVTFRNEWFERIIYILVGLAGIYLLVYLIKFWNRFH